MKANKEKIIRYLSREMTETEISEFNELLQSDENLMKEFNDFKKIYELIENSRSVKIDNDYLDSILPQFRQKISKQKNYLLKPAFAFTTILIIAGLIFLIFYQSPDTNSNGIFTDIPDEILLNSISDDYTNLLEPEKIDSLLAEKISINSDELNNYLFGDLDLTNLLNNELVTSDDEEAIYSALINKNF